MKEFAKFSFGHFYEVYYEEVMVFAPLLNHNFKLYYTTFYVILQTLLIFTLQFHLIYLSSTLNSIFIYYSIFKFILFQSFT